MDIEQTVYVAPAITDIGEAKSHVFGALVRMATPVLEAYHSDLYHDALWLMENLKGSDFTFFYGVAEGSTGMSVDFKDIEHMTVRARIRVWCHLYAVKMSTAVACAITGDFDCMSRGCELHYMSAPVHLAPGRPVGRNYLDYGVEVL